MGSPHQGYPKWKAQQKILWAEVREGSGRGKSQCKIRDLLADGRCSQAVLDFLSTTDVGRLVLAEEDAGSEVSEWERRESRSGKRRGGRSWALRRRWAPRRNYRCSYLRPPSWHPQTRTR